MNFTVTSMLFADIMTPLLETAGDVTWLEKHPRPIRGISQKTSEMQWCGLQVAGESGYMTGINLSVDGGFLAR